MFKQEKEMSLGERRKNVNETSHNKKTVKENNCLFTAVKMHSWLSFV